MLKWPCWSETQVQDLSPPRPVFFGNATIIHARERLAEISAVRAHTTGLRWAR
jgi:hypothetical protein